MKKSSSQLWIRIRNKLSLNKRQQLVIVTLILSLGLMATQLTGEGVRLDFILGLGLGAYVLSALVLRQGLSGWEYMTLLILPSFYTIAVYLFYLLLPTRWLTRLPIAFLYAIGMYAILLTENIYNVAAERTIQLLRAAHSVGFLLTLVTLFFLMDTIASFHMPFYVSSALIFIIVFLLSFQILWSVELAPRPSKHIWVGSLITSLLIAETAAALSFWPIKTTIQALFLTTSFYTVIGMTQQHLIGRLFAKTAREFILVLIVVLIIVIGTTKWGSGYV